MLDVNAVVTVPANLTKEEQLRAVRKEIKRKRDAMRSAGRMLLLRINRMGEHQQRLDELLALKASLMS